MMEPFIIICFGVNYPAGSTPILTFPLRGKGLLRQFLSLEDWSVGLVDAELPFARRLRISAPNGYLAAVTPSMI